MTMPRLGPAASAETACRHSRHSRRAARSKECAAPSRAAGRPSQRYRSGSSHGRPPRTPAAAAIRDRGSRRCRSPARCLVRASVSALHQSCSYVAAKSGLTRGRDDSHNSPICSIREHTSLGDRAMMSQEQNDLITRTGPKHPCGQLMRKYWQPAALVDELQGERPVRSVKVLGENLVLFRGENGRYGLIDRHCAHRGADLAFGRLENGGLRCAFHGWLFDASGQCIETPAEPKDSNLCKGIRQRAYPVVEKSGILWAYLGEGEPPAFPEIDAFIAPDSHTFAFKGHINCNWLQALEVGIDPAHASFLHRFFEDEDTSGAYGKQLRGASAGSEMPMTKILREYDNPIINVEHTEYGLRLIALRELDEARTHVRVTNQLFPHGFVIPMSQEMTISQWHLPVDDENCYWYAIFTSYTAPVDKQKMRDQRLELYELPDYKSRKNKNNDYGFDPHEQQTAT